MNDQFKNDLEWLAFCYVADELGSVERERFEQRLAEDQLAREAVERAVTLGQEIYATQNESHLPVERAHFQQNGSAPAKRAARFKAGFLLAASVALVLLSSAWFWQTRSESDNTVLADAGGDADSLVIAWAETLDQDSDDELYDADQDDFLFEDFDDQAVSWMVDAVAQVESDTNSTSGRIEQ